MLLGLEHNVDSGLCGFHVTTAIWDLCILTAGQREHSAKRGRHRETKSRKEQK